MPTTPKICNKSTFTMNRSLDFRPIYECLHEIRALVPCGVPFLAATATATPTVRREVISLLDMKGCEFIFASLDRPNIYYEVRKCTTIDVDFEPLVHSLVSDHNKAPQVVDYCRSLNMVADLYAHFVFSLGNKSYYCILREQRLSVKIAYLDCIMRILPLTTRTSYKRACSFPMAKFALFL